MAKRDKNRSYKEWEDEWGEYEDNKDSEKRARRDQRLKKQQSKEDWNKEDGNEII